ncbi:hypothetical protein [Microbacterium laevaniformans]|uniref:hypothetical protein n=1 Tax=Microbacterium laevaniformans TaxID=36807 RepID=UPI003D9741D6
MMLFSHTYSARIRDTNLPIKGGYIALDASTYPHVTCSLTTSIRALDLLDPRGRRRVLLTAQAETPSTTQVRNFDLALRSRTVDHRNDTATITLASDEALLSDYRPLTDDASPASMVLLRAIVTYVIHKVIPGAVIAPGSDAVLVLPDADPESLVWRAGVTAMEFLRPLLQAQGMRLLCDETRTWYLRNANLTGFGNLLKIETARTLIDGGDTIDLDTDQWFDAAVTRYEWIDADGTRQERVDAYGPSGYTRCAFFEKATPYPGAGFSEYAVQRAQGRGRSVTATTISDWTVVAEAPVLVTLPRTAPQLGAIDTVRFSLDNDEMTVTARTTSAEGTAWAAGSPGESWSGSDDPWEG